MGKYLWWAMLLGGKLYECSTVLGQFLVSAWFTQCIIHGLMGLSNAPNSFIIFSLEPNEVEKSKDIGPGFIWADNL